MVKQDIICKQIRYLKFLRIHCSSQCHMLQSTRAQFMSCEAMLFGDMVVAEPVSAASGLVLCVLALLGPPSGAYKADLPLEFWLARASLFACGLGTFVFHAIADKNTARYAVNRAMWDYLTMMMVATHTLLLFFATRQWSKALLAFVHVAAVLFAVYSNDYLSGAWLWAHTDGAISWGIQYPLFVIPYAIMAMYVEKTYNEYKLKLPLLLSVITALVAWFLERFACTHATAFAHSAWHVLIGFAGTHFICFGLRSRHYVLCGWWWPGVV